MAPRQRSSIVLVVEDDRDTRQLYRSALMAAGFTVVAVPDGVDALRFMEETQPAAVLLDLGLPRLHGSDVAREMFDHSALKHVPIVIVTGDVAGVDPTQFSCVLQKPITTFDLVDAVTRCLQAKGRPSSL